MENTEYYINREISWIAFNRRVLSEAEDETNPILERVKFLAISASNFDEFFMVRVAHLKDQLKAGLSVPENKTMMSPRQQIKVINNEAHNFVTSQYQIWNEQILPTLDAEGISILSAQELNDKQKCFINEYFYNNIYPTLTPLAVDACRPFPLLLNKSLNLAVLLEAEASKNNHKTLFAVVQVPSVLPRFVELPWDNEDESKFILLEDVIKQFVDVLFSGNRIISVSPFRITRNADIILDEEAASDLLEEIEKEVKKRSRGATVRLEVQHDCDPTIEEFLRQSLNIHHKDIYKAEGPLDLSFLMKFSNIEGYDELLHEAMPPQPPQDFMGETNIFEAIAKKDILVHHPYESFEPVILMLKQAAEDPNVLAVKQTLYRVSGNSPIIKYLMRAAENGKQVTVVVELKARFDEENNIVWARKLEEAGCHVIYGLVGYKIHCKLLLVVRQEKNMIKRYVHMGTGNYNESTAKLYTDIGMFTANDDLGIDASAIFNHLSGYMKTPVWRKIYAAPLGMRDKFIELIEQEIEHVKAGKTGRIIAKMNSLTDKDIIQALFKASMAGVKIDLIIRGICCLRPGIEGLSDNITVRSIVGRFLEHSRIYYFANAGDEIIYLSSADWMTRNLSRRVETMFPILQENLKERIKDILDANLKDNVKARILNKDGSYAKLSSVEPFSCQLYLYQQAKEIAQRQGSFYYKVRTKVADDMYDEE
ncbi:RNA degradosome polyphosphate kinase [Desulfuribacillus alkaliarsenatis]|uniref:Polyphosphate kinase n=1 Tax=Desulfuribacillus alkaliarsenatis TaxID=766136 RepID=A0A1E5G0Y6_9FIRM|nr:RNA degradosome polyphosphate kinase [Desulfuribacillus alkaliarsenatis]OEF96480.1 RNA degradosome polyphosphate kinase [Desulfuribacillus alkaliarsenatis]